MLLHSSKEVNDKDSKFNVGDRVRISKYNFFLQGYTPNWSEEIQFHGHMLLMISMVKKLSEHFMKKNYKKLISKNLG